MIEKCTCADYRSPAAEYQNNRYGHGMRVKNKSTLSNSPALTCTVCDKKTSSKKD